MQLRQMLVFIQRQEVRDDECQRVDVLLLAQLFGLDGLNLCQHLAW
jgi:hypothetical protein